MTVLAIVGIIVFLAVFYAAFDAYNRKLPIDLLSFEYAGWSTIGMAMILSSMIFKSMRSDNKIAILILGLIIIIFVAKELFDKLSHTQAIISLIWLIIISPFVIIVMVAIPTFLAIWPLFLLT